MEVLILGDDFFDFGRRFLCLGVARSQGKAIGYQGKAIWHGEEDERETKTERERKKLINK
jgi:hypothetical protein